MRSSFRILLFLLLSFAVNAATHAQSDTLLMTVDRLFELGVKGSLKVGADKIRERMASEQILVAKSALYPDLEIGLNAGVLGQPVIFQNGMSEPTYPEAPDWSQNYAVDFRQPLYTGGKIKGNISKAEITGHISRLQTLTDISELKLALLERYLTLLNLYKQRDVLSRTIEESEHRLVDIVRMKREGLITNNDVLRSEMQLTDNRLKKNETENDIALVSQQINILLDLDEDNCIMPDTSLLSRVAAIDSYEEYLYDAFAGEPSLLLLRKQTDLADREVSIARSEALPQLSLYAANTLARPVSRTLADMYNNNWNVGLSLSYSMSSLYKNRHKVNVARHNVLLMKNAEEQKCRELRMVIKNAYLKHKEALLKVDALILSLRQAEENYRIMQNRYMNQLAILTDLLDADNLRLNAELQLTNARTAVVYTYYELQKASGKF